MSRAADAPPALRARITDWFELLDANDNGLFEHSDLEEVARRVIARGAWSTDDPATERLRATHDALWEELWVHMDENRDGRVSREEFVSFWLALSAATRRAGLPVWTRRLIRSTFAAYDHDGDGVITEGEYGLYLRAIESAAHAPAAFARLDLDGNGHLDLDEVKVLFRQWLTDPSPEAPGAVLMTGRAG